MYFFSGSGMITLCVAIQCLVIIFIVNTLYKIDKKNLIHTTHIYTWLVLISVKESPDPSEAFATSKNLSIFLVSMSSTLSISAVTLLPAIVAGATTVQIKEILSVLKRLLFL